MPNDTVLRRPLLPPALLRAGEPTFIAMETGLTV